MARLKIIDNFDSSFVLDPEARDNLFSLLKQETFCLQLAQQILCSTVEFTELIFQPIPYTMATQKGLPAEYEQYDNTQHYLIINVRPTFMFKPKIFKTRRLC